MRHSVLSCGCVVSLLAIAACTASGSDSAQHGPVFDGDAGDGASQAHDGGGTSDAGTRDASSGGDGGVRGDASNDGGTIVDAGGDASDGSTCASTTALLAGGASALTGAKYANGQWTTQTLTGSAAAPIALASFGTGYVGVTVNAGDRALKSTTLSTTWSTPITIGTLASRDAPALAAYGGTLHLVYQAQSSDAAKDYKYFHGMMTGNAWDGATDPVGNPQSFGARGPSAAAPRNKLVILQSGSDGFLYDQTWDTSWAPANQQSATSVENVIPPTLIGMYGGSPDLLAVYARKTDRHLMFTQRIAGTWSSPIEVYDNGGAIAISNDAVSGVSMPNGGALIAFLGTNGKPYFTLYANGSWSAPATIVNATVLSAPSISAGGCGADAMAAYVDANGGAYVAQLSGTTWSTPVAVGASSGMTYAAIATTP